MLKKIKEFLFGKEEKAPVKKEILIDVSSEERSAIVDSVKKMVEEGYFKGDKNE